MLFKFNNVSFAYGEFYALKNLTFSCESGEIVGLVGENGAGKSTTIKNIVRHLKPDCGEILIGGRNILDIKDDYPVSYIPDMPVFYDELSLYEHLLFMKTIYPNNPVTIDELLDRLELRPYLNKLPFSLSKGTRQKLMIAIALLREYDILIADEPFSGLDPKQIVLLKKTFLKQKEQGKLVILSSHLLDVVENICDRFVILKHGQLVASGTKSELLQMAGLPIQKGSMEEAYMRLVADE